MSSHGALQLLGCERKRCLACASLSYKGRHTYSKCCCPPLSPHAPLSQYYTFDTTSRDGANGGSNCSHHFVSVTSAMEAKHLRGVNITLWNSRGVGLRLLSVIFQTANEAEWNGPKISQQSCNLDMIPVKYFAWLIFCPTLYSWTKLAHILHLFCLESYLI